MLEQMIDGVPSRKPSYYFPQNYQNTGNGKGEIDENSYEDEEEENYDESPNNVQV